MLKLAKTGVKVVFWPVTVVMWLEAPFDEEPAWPALFT